MLLHLNEEMIDKFWCIQLRWILLHSMFDYVQFLFYLMLNFCFLFYLYFVDVIFFFQAFHSFLSLPTSFIFVFLVHRCLNYWYVKSSGSSWQWKIKKKWEYGRTAKRSITYKHILISSRKSNYDLGSKCGIYTYTV